MGKGRVLAFIILVLVGVGLILLGLSRSTCQLDLLFTDSDPYTAVVILCSLAIGVVTGVLLK
jgi:hypothetical protein